MQKGFVKKGAAFIVAILLIFAMFNICTENGFAASANISLTGGGTFEKGDTVAVTLKYTGATFGSATARVTYDADVLEYVSCSGAEAGGSGGTVKVTMANGSGTDSLSCKLTFKAVKVGKSTVTASTSDIYNIDLEELTAGSKSTTVTVGDSSDTVSTNANLSQLYISAGTLSPAFSKNVTSYTVNVDNSVTEFLITAVKEDTKSTTKVTGSKEMKVGENTRQVIVTAENGKTKTYTVKIIRAKAADSAQKPEDTAQKPDESKPVENKPEDPDFIEVVVKDVTYIVEEDFARIDIPETFSVAAANYNDQQIPVIENQANNLVMGYLKEPESGEGQWYFYSEKQNQFFAQKYITSEQLFAYGDSRVEAAELNGGQEAPGNEDISSPSDDELISTSDMMLFIFCGTLGLLLLVVICLQVSIIRDKKQK